MGHVWFMFTHKGIKCMVKNKACHNKIVVAGFIFYERHVFIDKDLKK